MSNNGTPANDTAMVIQRKVNRRKGETDKEAFARAKQKAFTESSNVANAVAMMSYPQYCRALGVEP